MMRRLIQVAAALLLLFGGTALSRAEAQTTPVPAAGTAAHGTTGHQQHRQTLQQRFDAANAMHDGHLTKDQAAAANWSYVLSNFAAIDKDRKGYVTVADIHAFAHARYLARHKAAPATPAAPAAPAAPAPAN